MPEEKEVQESMDGGNMVKSQRNYGVDLLRVGAMLTIVTLHVLFHGGILYSAEPLSARYMTAWFIEAAGYCAVDVYGMISGYVGFGHKHKFSGFLQMYLQVVFYTVLLTGIFALVQPEAVAGQTVTQVLFPFAYSTYWYYTAYFCLFFFMPVLDRLMETLERAEAEKMLWLAYLLFGVLQTIFYKQFAGTSSGFSFLWLMVMYLTGAYIRKYDIGKTGRWKYLAGYFLCALAAWGAKIGPELLRFNSTGEYVPAERSLNLTSPFIIPCAFFLLVFFKEVHCGARIEKFVRTFTPSTFDVYLFHDSPLIRETFLSWKFTGLLALPLPLMVLGTVASGVLIWLLGNLVGLARIRLFGLLHIGQFCKWTDEAIQKLAAKKNSPAEGE